MGKKFDGACAPCWFDRVFLESTPWNRRASTTVRFLDWPKTHTHPWPRLLLWKEDRTEPDEYHLERRVMTV